MDKNGVIHQKNVVSAHLETDQINYLEKTEEHGDPVIMMNEISLGIYPCKLHGKYTYIMCVSEHM